MKRGEVWWGDLRPRSGSEQSGRRPVVIVSNDGFNQAPGWNSIMVVPFSRSPRQAQRGPTAINVARGAGGLPNASVAVCHQVTTVDRTKLSKLVGTLPALVLAEIEAGIKAAMDLP